MKTSIKYSIIALMLWSAGVAYGQQPEPITVTSDGKTYYQHGYNKTGDGKTDQSDGWEARDSVTVTSFMKYFVLPDKTVSPDYNPTTGAGTLNSKFMWEIIGDPATTGEIKSGNETPWVTIEWKTVGVDTVKVNEVPETGAACPGGGKSVMPVAIIAKPVLGFLPTATEPFYRDSICKTQAEIDAPPAGITVKFPMHVATSSSQVQASYTVTKDGVAFSTLDGADVPIPLTGEDANKLTITFPEYGLYVITLTEVTDRVSRNSFDSEGYIKGDLLDDKTTASKSFTFHLMRPVKTGPIYRLPNNY